MSNVGKRIFIRALMLPVLSCLNSCAATTYNYCPRYPVAGAKVASELEQISAEKLSATWEWIGRVDKLRRELEICAQPKL